MNTTRLFFAQCVMPLLPTTRCFPLKRSLLRWCGARVGRNVRIVSSARFHLTGELTVGDETWIGHQALIVGGDAEVCIGTHVAIAPRVLLVTGTHELHQDQIRAAGPGYSLPIRIEDGAWIGAGATILGGVTVGRRAMVGAGAVVNKHVLPNTVVAGIPARPISRLNESAGP